RGVGGSTVEGRIPPQRRGDAEEDAELGESAKRARGRMGAGVGGGDTGGAARGGGSSSAGLGGGGERRGGRERRGIAESPGEGGGRIGFRNGFEGEKWVRLVGRF